LYIGGDGLARGYWRRSDLTAARFVESPLDPARRLYRTGDLVRWRAGGALEFLGRIDQQVKIRGFRVELGEIEVILASHDRVRQSAVVVREDAPGQARLVAYVVGEVADTELRVYLRERLPDHMIPGAFVFLPALPVTSNGKLDRESLPAPLTPTAAQQPETEIEKSVAAVWAAVLRADAVGLDDNFFDIGGHSLMLALLHSRLQAALGREFPLLELFRNPTIRTFARSLVMPATQKDAAAGRSRAERQRQSMERMRHARASAR
jgi:hypothetical protein